MVVLQQNHVEEADAVVLSPSYLDSHLLEDAHAGGCLASVEHAGMRTLEALLILMGHGGDAAHALHDVQHQAFRLEKRLYFSLHNHGHVAGLHLSTVVDVDRHLHGRVEAAEDFLGHFDAGQYARFLNQ